MRGWLGSVVLVGVVIGLVLVLYLEPGKSGPGTLPLPEPDTITRLVVGGTDPGAEAVVLVRGLTHWRLTEPVDMPAEAEAVAALLELASARPLARYEVGSVDLTPLRLAPPVAQARFGAVALDYGGLTPIGDGRYVRISETVFVVPRERVRLWSDPLVNLASRDLVPGDVRVRGFGIGDARYRRDELGRWSAADSGEPLAGADAERLGQAATAWQGARARGVFRWDGALGVHDLDVLAGGASYAFRIHLDGAQAALVRPALGLVFFVDAVQRARMIAPLLELGDTAAAAERGDA